MIKPKSNSSVLPIVRITGNYQITIPILIRKTLGVNVGDYVQISSNQEGIAILKPVEIVTTKTKKRDHDEKLSERIAEEEMLRQYDEKDSIYDHIKL